MEKYNAHLKGREEYIFRQTYGAVGHIAISSAEYRQLRMSGGGDLHIVTWCGKNLKYGSYSTMEPRHASIRNACEYCFVEYSPQEEPIEREQGRQIPDSDVPF